MPGPRQIAKIVDRWRDTLEGLEQLSFARPSGMAFCESGRLWAELAVFSIQLAQVARERGIDCEPLEGLKFAASLSDDVRATVVANSVPTVDAIAACPGTHSAYRVGPRRYQVGESPPITLEEAEDHVLASLIDLGGAANKSQLEYQTGKTDGPRVLKSICRKHPSLAQHIVLPGVRGQGGYRTSIRNA